MPLIRTSSQANFDHRPCKMKIFLLAAVIVLTAVAIFFSTIAIPPANAQNVQAQTQQVTFNFVGQPQEWVVPINVTSITVDARGAQGGGNPVEPSAMGGKGGRIQTTLAVTPGDTLVIYVGGRGGDFISPNTGGPGGFNGGGPGGFDNVDANGPASGGGGASDVRRGGDGPAHRVVVAGGGGGAECCSNGEQGGPAVGGDGGGTTGASGGTVGGGSSPGGGGSQSGGGAGGAGCNGNGSSGGLGQGGVGGNGNRAGGGGGSGYYGGGGGGGCTFGSGGGGGSSYADPTATTGIIHTQGYQTGNGQVIITFEQPPSCVSPATGIVSWCPAEDNANDVIGSNNGTLQNGATFAAGKVGQAFSFDGVDDVITVPDAPNLDFGPNSPMTIELWAYRTGSSSTMHLIGKRANCSLNDFNYQMAFDPTNGLLFGGDLQNGPAITGQQMPLNVWTHLAGTFDGTTFRFYINGALAGTSIGTLGPINGAPLKIGSTGSCQPFGGFIDEVTLYNRDLHDSEIQAIFNAGSVGKCLPPISPYRVNQEYACFNCIGTKQYHTGIDINSRNLEIWSFDTPVNASSAGEIVRVLRVKNRNEPNREEDPSGDPYNRSAWCDGSTTYFEEIPTSNAGFGNVIILKNNDGKYSLYGHLDCIDKEIVERFRRKNGKTPYVPQWFGLGIMGNSYKSREKQTEKGKHARKYCNLDPKRLPEGYRNCDDAIAAGFCTRCDENGFRPHLHYELKLNGVLGDPRSNMDVPPFGYSTNHPDSFYYFNPFSPAVSGINPTTGAVGAKVRIKGTNFGNEGTQSPINKVLFGSAVATVVSWNDISIVVRAPAGSGTVDVIVETSGGKSNRVSFTY